MNLKRKHTQLFQQAKTVKRTGCVAACLLLGLLLASPAFGATNTWSSNSDNTWSAGSNWTPNNPASADTNVFNGAGSVATINFDASANIGGLILGSGQTSAVTITNAARTMTIGVGGLDMSNAGADLALRVGTVTLGATQTWNVGASRTLAVSNILSGVSAMTLTKAGEGKLVLSGSNTYTGGTVLSGGRVVVANNNALGASSSYISFNGGILQAGVSGITLAYTGGVHLNKTTGQIDTAGFNLTMNATFHNGGVLAKSGGGMLILDSSTVNTGIPLIINGGTVRRFGGWNGAGITINNDGRYYLYYNSQTITDSITINSTSGTAITFEYGSGTDTVSGQINLNSNAVFGVNSYGTAGAVRLNGKITGPGSLYLNSGNNTYYITNALNNYAGGTTINGGTLTVGSASALGTGPLTISGATLNLANVILSVGGLSGGGAITGGSGTPGLTVTQNSSTTYSGVIQNGSAARVAFTKAGTGTLTLSGASTYSGDTTVQNGTLKLASTGSLSNSLLITVASGAIFDVSAVSRYIVYSNLMAHGLVTGAVTVASSGSLGGGGTVSGVVTNLGTITAGDTNSCGTLILSSNLVMVAGSAFRGEYNATTSDMVNVTRQLSVGANCAVTLVPLDGAALSPRRFTLFTHGTLLNAENLATWTVNGTGLSKYMYQVKADATTVYANITERGTMVRFY